MTYSIRRVGLIAALVVFIASPFPLRADQNLPVLDELFESLDDALEAQVAVQVTRDIWAAWLQHDDDRVRAAMDAGIRDMEAQKWRDALGWFSAAIDLAPDFAEAWNKRATVYYLMGDFDASAADVVETLRLEPRHFGALSGQGMMYLEVGNLEMALVYFRRALMANPYMDNVRRYIEVLLQMQKDKTT